MNSEEMKFISPTDKRIIYSGRIDFSDDIIKYSHSGVSFSFLFEGKRLILAFQDGYNDYEIFMDGKYFKTIETITFKKKYEIFSSANREKHLFKIVKRTEGSYGIGIFNGIYIDNEGQILDLKKDYKYRFEFIGDSITCGYGVEATSPTTPNSRKYENFTKTYAYLLSEMLDAEYHVVAISGKGLVRNYGESSKYSNDPLPVYYERTLQSLPYNDWNFTSFIPDIVFIALGENDFSTEPVPDAENYYKEYKKFLTLIRKNYSDSKIVMICTISSRKIYKDTLKNTYDRLKKEFSGIYYFEFPVVQNDELGCDSHPNYIAQEKFAISLYKFLADEVIK